jgi:hypothetical protein
LATSPTFRASDFIAIVWLDLLAKERQQPHVTALRSVRVKHGSEKNFVMTAANFWVAIRQFAKVFLIDQERLAIEDQR